MKAIIIGAGRGNRLMPLTDGLPKCMMEVGDKRVLDWMLEALTTSGITDIVFIGGYQIQEIKLAYTNLRFCHNTDWCQNNILASLFYAEKEMNGPFVSTYSDILYRPSVVEKLMQSGEDITLVVDIDWRARYVGRTLHPESEAEKVIAENDRVVGIGKHLDADEAYGEFIGLAKFSEAGTEILKTNYHRVVRRFQGRPFHAAPSLKKAYLTDMIQELIDHGYRIGKVDIQRDWIEVDTTQDFEKAKAEWRGQVQSISNSQKERGKLP